MYPSLYAPLPVQDATAYLTNAYDRDGAKMAGAGDCTAYSIKPGGTLHNALDALKLFVEVYHDMIPSRAALLLPVESGADRYVACDTAHPLLAHSHATTSAACVFRSLILYEAARSMAGHTTGLGWKAADTVYINNRRIVFMHCPRPHLQHAYYAIFFSFQHPIVHAPKPHPIAVVLPTQACALVPATDKEIEERKKRHVEEVHARRRAKAAKGRAKAAKA